MAFAGARMAARWPPSPPDPVFKRSNSGGFANFIGAGLWIGLRFRRLLTGSPVASRIMMTLSMTAGLFSAYGLFLFIAGRTRHPWFVLLELAAGVFHGRTYLLQPAGRAAAQHAGAAAGAGEPDYFLSRRVHALWRVGDAAIGRHSAGGLLSATNLARGLRIGAGAGRSLCFQEVFLSGGN